MGQNQRHSYEKHFWWHIFLFSCDRSFVSFALGTHDCGDFLCICMLVCDPFSPFSHHLFASLRENHVFGEIWYLGLSYLLWAFFLLGSKPNAVLPASLGALNSLDALCWALNPKGFKTLRSYPLKFGAQNPTASLPLPRLCVIVRIFGPLVWCSPGLKTPWVVRPQAPIPSLSSGSPTGSKAISSCFLCH